MDEQFTADLLNAKSVDEFLEIVDKADDEKSDIDERLADTGEAEGAQAKLLAVTACPTGIAHTYMAAEGLEKAAKAKNCFIKMIICNPFNWKLFHTWVTMSYLHKTRPISINVCYLKLTPLKKKMLN